MRKIDPLVGSCAVFAACVAASIAIGYFLVPHEPMVGLTQGQGLWLLAQVLLLFVGVCVLIGGAHRGAA